MTLLYCTSFRMILFIYKKFFHPWPAFISPSKLHRSKMDFSLNRFHNLIIHFQQCHPPYLLSLEISLIFSSLTASLQLSMPLASFPIEFTVLFLFKLFLKVPVIYLVHHYVLLSILCRKLLKCLYPFQSKQKFHLPAYL